MSFLLCTQRRHKSCLDREKEGVPCVKFSDVDPGTSTLSAGCSNGVVSSSVEGSCGKTEQEGSSAV